MSDTMDAKSPPLAKPAKRTRAQRKADEERRAYLTEKRLKREPTKPGYWPGGAV